MITTQKISVSLPSHLYDYLAATVSPREISSYISQAIERTMLSDKIDNSIDSFLDLRKITPKFKNQDLLLAIHKGRT